MNFARKIGASVIPLVLLTEQLKYISKKLEKFPEVRLSYTFYQGSNTLQLLIWRESVLNTELNFIITKITKQQ